MNLSRYIEQVNLRVCLIHNNNRIENAKSEGELWKIANEVVKPKMDNTIKLIVNGVCIEEEALVAETFNNYFVEKIHDLKDGIDQTIKIDPLEKLAGRMKNKTISHS